MAKAKKITKKRKIRKLAGKKKAVSALSELQKACKANKKGNGKETGKPAKVGPGHPPADHQFKPGCEGGPGRPPTKPITDALRKISSGPVTLKIDGEKRTFKAVDALAQVAFAKAMKGDLSWWNAVTERLEGRVGSELTVKTDLLPGLDAETLAFIAEKKGGPE